MCFFFTVFLLCVLRFSKLSLSTCHMEGWLKNTGKAAQAINNSLYLLRPFKVTVWLCCVYIWTYGQGYQWNDIPSPYSHICLHFCKFRFAEVNNCSVWACWCENGSLPWQVPFLLQPSWPLFITVSLI